jgi:hypothetical protein
VKKPIAFVLILVGAAIMIFGGYRALSTLAGLYQRNIDDALGQPDNSEQAASAQMLHGVYIGAAGMPLFLTGMIMRRAAAVRARRAAR